MASPLEPDASGGRDRRGRFRQGNRIGAGAGAAAHKENKLRGALQAAVTRRVTPQQADAWVDMLLEAGMQERDPVAIRMLTPYILGKIPDSVSGLQTHAPTKIARQAPMRIEDIAAGLQEVYHLHMSGRLSDTEAGTIRALLESLLHVRQTTDVQQQLATIETLLEQLKEARDA